MNQFRNTSVQRSIQALISWYMDHCYAIMKVLFLT